MTPTTIASDVIGRLRMRRFMGRQKTERKGRSIDATKIQTIKVGATVTEIDSDHEKGTALASDPLLK